MTADDVQKCFAIIIYTEQQQHLYLMELAWQEIKVIAVGSKTKRRHDFYARRRSRIFLEGNYNFIFLLGKLRREPGRFKGFIQPNYDSISPKDGNLLGRLKILCRYLLVLYSEYLQNKQKCFCCSFI